MARPADPPPTFWIVGRIAAALGTLAGLAVVATLGDPGITIDEPLDVRPGRAYVAAIRAEGPRFFEAEIVRAVFADNAEHPPLGRWLLGIASTVGEPFEAILGGPDPFSVHAGRIAPALAFAVLAVLVTHAAGQRYGRAAGLGAGLGLVLMPRMFAHAHLAALDTFVALFWTASLLAAARAMESRRMVPGMMAAGVVWGLALLTKIHAWLLPPIVLVYALATKRSGRAVAAVAGWTAVGLVVFAVGWPWLWYETAARLQGYLATSVERVTLQVQYFGRVYPDRLVPWHYPWFYFAVTVPIGFQALGLVGLGRGWKDRRDDPFPLLLAGSIGVVLLLFSTNVPIYDGERLFLVAFPAWAILIGLGFGTAWDRAKGRRLRRWALAVAFAAQGYGVVAMHPFGLSYYNALVGGLPGAERLGLELTYWGDAIDPVLLDELANRAGPGQSAALAPTLHHMQAAAAITPGLLGRGVRLVDDADSGTADWLVVYRRTCYWNPELRRRLAESDPTLTRSRQGVWLSGLWDPAAKSPRSH